MSQLTPVPSFPTKETYAYQVLREAILKGKFTAGERLVMERLSKEMGISPIPLRAALQRLESEGLVEITPHSGAIVAPVSQAEIGDIFLLLEALEAPAFRAAARRVTAEDLATLQSMVDEMETAAESGDVEAWGNTNELFHRTVASLSGIRLLTEMTGRALDQWARLRRSFAPVLAGRMAQAQDDHRRMMSLLLQGDGESLAELAAAHNRRARIAYEDRHKTAE